MRGKSPGENLDECSSNAVNVHIKERVAKIQRHLAKQAAGERLAYVTAVNKKNEHGKVQARLLAITNAAVYNVTYKDCKLKRRIAFEAIASVTSEEGSGSFVLHVPREYDYLYTATNAGVAVDADGRAAEYTIKGGAGAALPPASPEFVAAHVIDALQCMYALSQGGSQQLPVRTFARGGGLAQVVQRKGHSQESVRFSSNQYQYDDDDDDDDD